MDLKDSIKKYYDSEIILFREFSEELKKEWKAVEDNIDCYVFQRYDWNEYWAHIFCDLYDYYIIIVRRNLKPSAVFPFCINKRGVLRKLQFIGLDQSDYLSPVISYSEQLESDIWEMILDKIKGKFDLILLEKIPELIKSRKNPFLDLIRTAVNNYSFGINLPGTYEEFDSSLKRNFRNDTKRNLKRLKELGNLEFIKVPVTEADHNRFDQFIEISLEQKARRIRNYLGNRFLEEYHVNKFYKELFMLKTNDFEIDYTILTLDNSTLLATHLGFFDTNRYYYILPTLTGTEWYKYSCGKVLIDNLVEFSISKGHKYFDFTVGDEDYKRNWCNNKMAIHSLIKAVSLVGLLPFISVKVSEMVRNNEKLKKIWRSAKHRLISRRKRK